MEPLKITNLSLNVFLLFNHEIVAPMNEWTEATENYTHKNRLAEENLEKYELWFNNTWFSHMYLKKHFS